MSLAAVVEREAQARRELPYAINQIAGVVWWCRAARTVRGRCREL
jgi:hypothetical protein